MKKIIFICGIIAGLISVGWFIFSSQIFKLEMSEKEALFFGYASMVLAFSLIFVGIKNFRDNYKGGVIGRVEAIKVALLITAVASTVYVGVWLIDYYFFTPDYMAKYTASLLAGLKASHASQATIDKQMAQMAEYAKTYNNPFLNALVTYREIVPVGVLMSFIAALVLETKPRPGSRIWSNILLVLFFMWLLYKSYSVGGRFSAEDLDVTHPSPAAILAFACLILYFFVKPGKTTQLGEVENTTET